MAKRYSQSDQQKMATDKMHELRERGLADVHQTKDICVLHPGGLNVALDTMLSEPNATKDQTQEQIGAGKLRAKENMKRHLENQKNKKK